MKIQGKLVDWILDLDPRTYSSYVVIEKGVKVLYVEILWALYKILEAALLWYREFRHALEEIRLKFNPYDSCVATRGVNNKQQIIRFQVNDVMLSQKISEVNNKFSKWAKENVENWNRLK